MSRPLSNLIGFDDAPFARAHRGDVPVVGVVFASERLDGVVVGKVRRDGRNSTSELTRLISTTRFAEHVRAVLLQGIALAGFNVIDIRALSAAVALPVLCVARREPNYAAIRHALLARVPGGARKWALIERVGPMEPMCGVYVQRAGLSAGDAQRLLAGATRHGSIPEPLRIAHLIAGAIASGQSRGGC